MPKTNVCDEFVGFLHTFYFVEMRICPYVHLLNISMEYNKSCNGKIVKERLGST